MASQNDWRSFVFLLGSQVFTAFADNTARFVLLPMGTALALEMGVWAPYYQHIIAVLLVLPFFLFSPVAGWIADRFAKNRVILAALGMQIGIFLAVAAALHGHQIWWASAGFFWLALQATLLSPAKNGIIKELVGQKSLHFANGILEMAVVLAVLAGMFCGAWWFDSRYQTAPPNTGSAWSAALIPVLWLCGLSCLTVVLGLGLRHQPARQLPARFEARLLVAQFSEFAWLWRDPVRRRTALGIGFFWFCCTLIQLIVIEVAELATGGQGGMGKTTAWMIACASGGVALGALLAALVGRRKSELGLIPLGAFCLALAAFAGLWLPSQGLPWALCLLSLGVASAVFYIPLFAYLQELAPENARGRVLAASNLLNNLAIVLAALCQALFLKYHVSIAGQLGLLGLAAGVVFACVMRWFAAPFFRLMILPAVRVIWNVSGKGMENFPPTGGVLLVSNHVSYLDAFVLSSCCPRPIRFLMYEGYYNMWWSKWFLDIFGALPIAQNKALGAIKAASDALNAGEVVCIFPEGKLTTSGAINAFQAGMEIILKRAPVPVVPASLHGLWGSVFSYAGGKPFCRLPRLSYTPVHVQFAAPMAATTRAAEAEATVRKMFDIA